MNNNFDTIIDRRNSNSLKWEQPEGRDILPMWVADMDFTTATPIIDALRKRVEHGIYGYTCVPAEYYQAIDSWFTRRHRWHVDAEDVIYTIGVVPGIYCIVGALTSPGDKVIIPSPAYSCFYSCTEANGCVVAPSLLINDNGHYTLDFDDIEKLASQPEARLLILCNPHNPVGRVWTPDELRLVAEICARHNVIVVSDEIHCELSMPGHDYTPFVPIAQQEGCRWVACNSPSKAFNLAGLRISNIVCHDSEMRQKIQAAITRAEAGTLNAFGVTALIAAYNDCEEWLDELRKYLHENYKVLVEECHRLMSKLVISPLEATYLAWIDISATGLNADEVAALLLEKEGLRVSAGSIYGPGGEHHLRVNIGCPRSTMLEGIERMARVLQPLLLKDVK